MHNTETAIDQAIGWHLRRDTMGDADWEAFATWLEADTGHARAYDRVALLDATLPRPVPRALPEAANDNPPRRWGRWLSAGAIAAAVALALPFTLHGGAKPYSVETRPGETREVALADGTRIEVAGGSRLTLDRGNARVATLERGEAVFHVRYDPSDPFTLHSGGVAIRDMGTVFDVTRAGPRLDVAVAEGSVMFRPSAEAITLTRGQALSLREDRGVISRSDVSPDEVGGWRQGALSFRDATVGDVVATLTRLYGTQIAVSGSLSGQQFTGMVRMSGAAERDIPHVAELIGTTWRKHGDQWTLGTGSKAAR